MQNSRKGRNIMATFRWPSGWDPLLGFRAMQKELERLSRRDSVSGRQIGGGAYPPVNVLNGSTELIVECEIPGLKREDIDLSITGETLQIKGSKKPITASEDVRYQCHQRGMGDFSRTIVLPDRVDSERISASLVDGILTVRLPKTEAALSVHIDVK